MVASVLYVYVYQSTSMRIPLFVGTHKIKTCITLLLSICPWLVRTTEINKDAIPTIWTPHTCHKNQLEVLLESGLLYKSWVWS